MSWVLAVCAVFTGGLGYVLTLRRGGYNIYRNGLLASASGQLAVGIFVASLAIALTTTDPVLRRTLELMTIVGPLGSFGAGMQFFVMFRRRWWDAYNGGEPLPDWFPRQEAEAWASKRGLT
jgi:hypothetical protein